MSRHEDSVKALIASVDAAGEFVTDVDGFVYYWQSPNHGHLSAWMLRAIANELDQRNAAWNAELEAFFSTQRVVDPEPFAP